MARYVDAIDLPLPIERAFDHLADFRNVADWDPGVVAAEELTSGPIGLGSRFRVVASFLGRRILLTYEITEFERPARLVLCGGDASLRSVDELTFVPRRGGTRLTYEARLELAGLARLADPLLDRLFQRIGSAAARGLREQVGRLAREQKAPGAGRRNPRSVTEPDDSRPRVRIAPEREGVR